MNLPMLRLGLLVRFRQAVLIRAELGGVAP